MSELRPCTLSPLLQARSVVVVGASMDPTKLSGRPLKYLLQHGYRGRLYVVNPAYRDLHGIPAYPDAQALPEVVDLAVICLPAAKVPEALKSCCEKGIPAAVILASGFAETGFKGASLQQRVAAIAAEHRALVCGPNSVGIINVWDRLTASFSAQLEQELLPGPIAFVSQSGAMGTTIFNLMQDEGLGFSYFVCSGNEAVLESLDYIEAFIADERARIIAAYIEGFRGGRKLLRVGALAQQAGKRLVILKAGRTESGKRAALSHTAAVTGSYAVYQAASKQAGVVSVNDVDELVDACRRLSQGRTLPGRRVAILTGSGAAGVLSTDHLIAARLEVPTLPPRTQASLKKVLPAFATCENPIDLTAHLFAEPGLLQKALDILAAEESLDGVALVLSLAPPEVARRLASDVIALAEKGQKPLAVCWLGGSMIEVARDLLRTAGIPVYESLASLASGLRLLADAGRAKVATFPGQTTGSRPLLPISLRLSLERGGILPYRDARSLLNVFGIPGLREAIVQDPAQAAMEAKRIGFPVVVKLLSPKLTHKTDAGAVRLGLRTCEEVEEAARDLTRLARRELEPDAVEGILVQEMIAGGRELLLGAVHDPEFGPVLTLGLGGIFVEILRDVTHRLPPLSLEEAEAMIDETAVAHILKSMRGHPNGDRAALIAALLKLSMLLEETDHLVGELDINPLLVLDKGHGLVAIDARVVGRKPRIKNAA